MMRSILISADRLIPVAEIAGTCPSGCDVQVRAILRDAISASSDPRLSFAGVHKIGEEFITRNLAPVLFDAARAGRPALATEIDREVAQRLHSGLRSVGALLHHADTEMALGASSQLVDTLGQFRRGQRTAARLAASLGISEVAATNRLGVLAHWGLIPPAAHGRASTLPIAA